MKAAFLIFYIWATICCINIQPINAQETPANRENRPPVKWVNIPEKTTEGLSHHVYSSGALGTEVGYIVWLPQEYNTNADKRFPVIYFLHGMGGHEGSDAVSFSTLLNEEIEKNNLQSVICIFPNGGRSGYRNEVEDMIVRELIPKIDATYRTQKSKNSRGTIGFSMGGSGSVYLALKYPELFCFAGSLGGGIRMNEELQEQYLQNNKAIWKANHFGFYLVNGDQDRPEAFQSFASKLDSYGIHYVKSILPETNHNLGLYFEKPRKELISFIQSKFN